MSGTQIEYTIEQKGKYFFALGNLDSIQQKNSDGFTIQHIIDNCEVNLKLKTPAIVYMIEVVPIITEMITFQLFDKSQVLIEEQQITFDKQRPKLVQFPKCRQQKKVVSKIKVILLNIQTNTEAALGLKYLLVRGEKVDTSKAKRDITKKPAFFEDARLSPHAISYKTKESGAVFSQRKRTKEKEVKEPNEDSQMRRAIEMSKKQAEERGSLPSRKIEEEIPMRTENNHHQERDYPLVDYDKVKQFYANVNSSWLQAQKRMQIEKGIKQQHRLSNLIQVKHLYGKNICIDIAPVQKREQLEKLAESMGAKLIKEVTDNCLLITTRKDTEKVSKARKCKNVKVLSPKYIEECKQCEASLNESDYFLHL